MRSPEIVGKKREAQSSLLGFGPLLSYSDLVFGRRLKHNHDVWVFGIWPRFGFLKKARAKPKLCKMLNLYKNAFWKTPRSLRKSDPRLLSGQRFSEILCRGVAWGWRISIKSAFWKTLKSLRKTTSDCYVVNVFLRE